MPITKKGHFKETRIRITKPQDKWIKQQARFQFISEAEVVRQIINKAMTK